MRNILKHLVLGTFALLWGSSLQAQTIDFALLMSRVKTEKAVNIMDVTTMDNWVSSQNANGSWSTFTYGTLTTANGINTTDNHILRLWNLAAACTKVGHAKYNDTLYKNAVKNGLAYWYSSKTVDTNWWYNEIYFPQKLGEILIFLREFSGFIPTTTSAGIDEPEILSLFTPVALSDITSHDAGANSIDIATHYIYRGVLTQNATLLQGTRDVLQQSLTTNIKSDFSYQEHGAQLHIGSYGWVYADGLIRLASYLSGTSAAFDINGQNFGMAIKFIRETQIASVRGNSWDFSVIGRAISRPNALNAGMSYLQKMATSIDPANATTYNDALARMNGTQPASYNVRQFNKQYWISDYMQHVRAGYFFGIRNVSTRTVESETGNGENLKANNLSYGATFISVDGTEYKNIMPYWEWRMIPGTTFPFVSALAARGDWVTRYGTTTFVGGVSDSTYGAAVLDLNKSGMTGKKSWFCFDNEVVCLGAGISDNSGYNVRTTIDQAIMTTQSYIVSRGSTTETTQSVSSSTYSNTNPLYIRQGKIAYFFPTQNSSIKYTMKSQSGAWHDINTTQSTATVSGYVFSLWVDHGTNPSNATYSYIVVPGIDTYQKAQAYDLSLIDIVQNTTAIQAVKHKSSNVLEVIFHAAGTLTYGNLSITVNQPCALMLRNGTLVTVADPRQTNSSIVVSIVSNGVQYNKTISLNTSAGMAGSPVTVDFNIPSGNTAVNDVRDMQIVCLPNHSEPGLMQLTTDFITPARCEVRDLMGKVIISKDFTQQTMLDLQQQPAGVYILTILHDQQVHNKKIIKY